MCIRDRPGGGDIAVGLHQFLVTAVHVHTNPVNRRIDFLRLGALARGDVYKRQPVVAA